MKNVSYDMVQKDPDVVPDIHLYSLSSVVMGLFCP
jgi:hypothetical protein